MRRALLRVPDSALFNPVILPESSPAELDEPGTELPLGDLAAARSRAALFSAAWAALSWAFTAFLVSATMRSACWCSRFVYSTVRFILPILDFGKR